MNHVCEWNGWHIGAAMSMGCVIGNLNDGDWVGVFWNAIPAVLLFIVAEVRRHRLADRNEERAAGRV